MIRQSRVCFLPLREQSAAVVNYLARVLKSQSLHLLFEHRQRSHISIAAHKRLFEPRSGASTMGPNIPFIIH